MSQKAQKAQKAQRTRWWIFTLSILWTWIIRIITSTVFALIGPTTISTDPSLLTIIKAFMNRILVLLSLLSMIVGLPLGIVRLVKWYRNLEYDAHVKLEANEIDIEKIYTKEFDISSLSKNDITNIQKTSFKKVFSPWLAVFLNIITLGLFSFFKYGFQHDYLPIIKKNDFWSWKAIWFMFIPIFNFYWMFVLRIKLANRINLQYKVRNKAFPISKWLVIITLILTFVPYVNYIAIFILQSIVVYQIQTAINGLVEEIQVS